MHIDDSLIPVRLHDVLSGSKSRILLLIFLVVSSWSASHPIPARCLAFSQAADAPAKAEQVLSRYEEAVGGMAALARLTDLTRRGIFKVPSNQFPAETRMLSPHRWMYSLTFKDGPEFRHGSTGKQGWRQFGDFYEVLSQTQHYSECLSYDPQALSRIKEFYPEVVLRGKETTPEGESYVLEARSPWGTQLTLYFTAESNLLARYADDWDEVTLEDYREINGVRIPFRIHSRRRNETMVFSEARTDAGPDGAFFQLPAPLAADPQSGFARVQARIAMRDGSRLYTEIFLPGKSGGSLPILLLRTPYGANSMFSRFKGYLKELAEEEFIFAFQDIRGSGKSGGSRLPMEVRHKFDGSAIDEGTDAFDTIDWLVKNIPRNNGRVGMLGASYSAWLSMMAAQDPHPALKAVTDEASPADEFLGDDFHHNGAFRLGYAFEISLPGHNKPFDRYDTFEWFLRQGSLANLDARYLQGKSGLVNDLLRHPDYDEFWKTQAWAARLEHVPVPVLNVAGWWDQENFYGPQKIYERLETRDTGCRNFLVIGPWNHGGWNWDAGSQLGKLKFGSETGVFFRKEVRAPWFRYFLKDEGKLDLPEALIFQTGTNQWMKYDRWPAYSERKEQALYFAAEGRLAFTALDSAHEPAWDSYFSDPSHPVPYRARPIESSLNGTGWANWLTEDQRFVHQRPDVLSWETDPLAEDLTISGEILAHIYASTSGTDSDWIVKLIDVFPEKDRQMPGYQLMIAGEVMRGRYFRSFEKPEPLPADKPLEYRFSLHGRDHCFLKGHRVMVQIQSTWFPLLDRNPQRFVPSIYLAQDSDYQSATQRIFRSPAQASHLELPVVRPIARPVKEKPE